MVLPWGLYHGGLSWGFCHVDLLVYFGFVIGVSWGCHGGFVGFVNGVLLALSMGFCWLCHDGFIGFVIRVMFGLPLGLYAFVIGFFWGCHKRSIGFVMRVKVEFVVRVLMGLS